MADEAKRNEEQQLLENELAKERSHANEDYTDKE